MRPETLRALRSTKRLSQDDVARLLGISQPQYSLIETGKRTTRDVIFRLEEVLALGDRGEFEESPVFVLATYGLSGQLELLYDASGRLGVYRGRSNAELAHRIVKNEGRMTSVMLVPAWLSYVALDLVQRRGVLASRDDLYVVDSDGSEETTAIEIAKHAVGLVAAATNSGTYEEIAERLAREVAATRERAEEADAT